jgi:hypothetical protein
MQDFLVRTGKSAKDFSVRNHCIHEIWRIKEGLPCEKQVSRMDFNVMNLGDL